MSIGACLPLMMLVALMAPKGQAKEKPTKEKPEPVSKRAKKDDQAKDASEKQAAIEAEEARLKEVKIEPDTKGKLPAIPADHLARLNSRLRGLQSKGAGQPLDDFLSKTREQKRDWFWNKYRFDKNIIYCKREEKRESVESEITGSIAGQMSKWEIAKLNGALPGIPNYEAICNAYVDGLPVIDHPNQKLHALGERLYEYIHHKHKETMEVDSNTSTLLGKVDLDTSSHAQACLDLDLGKSISSSSQDPQLSIAPWKQEWLAAIKEAKEKILALAKKAVEEADKLHYNLKLDSSNALNHHIIVELDGKLKEFDVLTKAFGDTLVALNLEAKSEDLTIVAKDKLNEDSKNMDYATKTFKLFVSKVKNFTA